MLASAKALHDAGVDLLVGTDASAPLPFLGGVAHGASVHHELQYVVRAGLTPIEALRAATSVTARQFSLNDRGRIAPGLRADLLLVDGHPLADVSATLDIRDVWRRGRTACQLKPVSVAGRAFLRDPPSSAWPRPRWSRWSRQAPSRVSPHR